MPKKPIKLSTKPVNVELPILERLREEYIIANYTPKGERKTNHLSMDEWQRLNT